MPVHAFCSPQKGSRFTLGRSPGLEGAMLLSQPAASPSPANTLSGIRSDAPSLTVAEPRRICTGLPCYAHRGHPRRSRLYRSLFLPVKD